MIKHQIAIIIVIAALVGLSSGFLYHMRGLPAQGEAQQEQGATVASTDTAQADSAVPEAAEETEEEAAREMAQEHIYAHRATSGTSLEHSFRQYDQAIADGARYIEQDIVISRDGTLFVSHDLTAARMTGTNRAFSDMTDAEIDRLRTYEGEPTLRLSDVFDRYETDIHYVIELKSTDQRTIDAFTELVNQYGYQDRIIVQCFYLQTLQRLEEIFPDMPKLYLVQYPSHLDEGYDAPYVDIISAEMSMMTEENVNQAHERGKLFSIWPLTDEGAVFSDDELRRAIDLGVDTYFTDDVKQAMSIEETYGYEVRKENSGAE